jgi:hypothetical protein
MSRTRRIHDMSIQRRKFSKEFKISSQEARIAQLERMLGKLYLEKEFLKKTVEHLEMIRSQKS